MLSQGSYPERSQPWHDRCRHALPLADALKFNGPAPELINGRLAMVRRPLCALWHHALTLTSHTLTIHGQGLDLGPHID